ncbi:MAG: VirB4 family type IV secretion system protein [Candidatus Dormibacteria bacterium]
MGSADPCGEWLLAQAPDLLDLATGEQGPLVASFEAWLEQLRTPLRLRICSRREPPPEPTAYRPTGAAAPALAALLAVHLQQSWGRVPVFRRQVFLLPQEATAGVASVLPETEIIALRPHPAPLPLAEGPWRESPSALAVGGRWLRSLWLRRLPGVALGPGWLWSLTGLPGEYDICLDLIPRGSGAADRGLRRRVRGLQAQDLLVQERGEGSDPRVSAALAAAGRLREVLARAEGRLFELAVAATVVGDTREEAERLSSGLRSRVEALRGALVPAWFDQAPTSLVTGWGAASGAAQTRIVSGAELAACWPWLDDWCGEHVDQVHLGRHLRTGAPVLLDLHRSPDLPNANLVAVGASGSGKSYLAGLLGLEAARLGIPTVILDPENEHSRWCAAVGGRQLAVGAAGAVPLNLLELVPAGEAPTAVTELVSLLCGPLSPVERGLVARAVTALLGRGDAGGAPRLSDCLGHLRRSREGRALALRLLPWLEGDAGSVFNRAGSGPEVVGAVAVGVRDLPEAWVPGATLLISHWLWSWVRRQPGRKQAIVDEAGLLAGNPPLQRLMAQLARRIRKYGGSLVLLTQSAGDLFDSAAGEQMAVNSATALLGNQLPAAAVRLQRAYQLDDAQRHWLELAGRGDFLLLRGRRRSPVHIEAPPGYHRWIATNPGAIAGPQLVPPGARLPDLESRN